MSSSEPQFATVSLLISEDVAGTFRVPINDETTVRRLAKDAMQRLLTRRSDGRHIFTRENISVTEVFVNCGPHKAEVFAQDLVTQVVRVKEEVVHMRLRLKEGGGIGVGGGESSTTATTTNSTNNNTINTAITTNDNNTIINNNNNNNNNNNTMDMASTTTMHTVEIARTVEVDETSHATTAAVEKENAVNEVSEEKTTAGGTKRRETKAEVTAVVKKTEEATKESGRRSGVSVSSRQRKQQTVEEKKEREEKQKEEKQKEEKQKELNEKEKEEKQKPEKESAVATKSKRVTTTTSSKRVSKPITVNVTTVDKKNSTNSTEGGVAEVQKTTKSRLGWGPEADKYFPDNYVSSPDKLMIKTYAKKTNTTTNNTATATNTTTTTTAAANAKKKTTSSSKVAEKDKKIEPSKKEESLVEKEESDTTEESRRPGWGPEADKYFADNYVSSPNKLMSKVQTKKTTTTTATATNTATNTTTTAATNGTTAANARKKTTSSSKVAEKDKEVEPPKEEKDKEVEPPKEEEESLVEKEESDTTEGPRRPGWGPEADKYFADNYVSSPNKIPRLIREAKKREKQQQEEEAKRKAQEGKNYKTVVEVEEEEQQQQQKEKEVKKQIDTHAGSSTLSRLLHSLEDKQNAETHTDYISTSRRSGTLVRRLNNENENEEEEEPRTAPAALTAAELTPQTTLGSISRRGKNNSTGSRKRQLAEMNDGTHALCPVVVERQLMYDVADEAGANRTPTAQSTRQIIEGNEEKIEEEEEQLQQRPPGWGKEALRYFDADTYFDDPSKAKLSPEILARPVRARREVVLPYYFTTISM